MATDANEPHLPSLLDGMNSMVKVPQKQIAEEMGYSETHFSRILEPSKNDIRFALKYAVAMGALVERQRNSRIGNR